MKGNWTPGRNGAPAALLLTCEAGLAWCGRLAPQGKHIRHSKRRPWSNDAPAQ